MKKLVILGLVVCVLTCAAAGAFAWEIKLKGITEYQFRYLTRFGQNDIFGTVTPDIFLGINHVKDWPTEDTNNSGLSDINAANTIATRAPEGVKSGEPGHGADQNEVRMRATLYPTIKVNKAVKLSGAINLTSLGIHSGDSPYNNVLPGGYYNSTWVPINNRMAGANVPNMFVTTDWWKISIKLPIMDLSLGTKTSGVGMGIWKNKCQRASTSFGMKVKYGPLTFSSSPYIARADSDWDTGDYRDSADGNPPYRKDNNRDYLRGIAVGVTYKCGPLELGVDKDGHVTDESPRVLERNAAGQQTATSGSGSTPNRWVHDTDFWLKYANGRFFLNAELAWFWQYASGASAPAGTQNKDQDAMIYGVEMGTLFGPTKFTLSYIRATGDNPWTRETTEDALHGDAGISSCYVKNWAYLMEYIYGTGSGFDAEGQGQPSNYHHLGARVDYAVAANLNVFGTWVYGWRDQPQAYFFGGDGANGLAVFDNDNAFAGQQSVPDSAREVGWELDLGFDWKLLENFTWHTIFAYWQPGIFWGYAAPNTVQVIATAGTTNLPSVAGEYYAAGARVNPTRDIDPLFGIQSTFSIHF